MLTVLEVLSKYYGTTSLGMIADVQLNIMNAQLPTLLNPMTQFCQSVKIPYEAPGHPDIPSLDEIDKAMVDNRLTQRGGAYDVCRVRNSVIKCGRDEAVFQEAESLLFLQEHSQVRAPKLYAAFTRIRPGMLDTHYMVSELIEGETLGRAWDTLDARNRETIAAKLIDQLQLLRAVPSPGYYGRVHHQSWCRTFRYCRTNWITVCGPYDTYEDFVDGMYNSIEHEAAKDTYEDFVHGMNNSIEHDAATEHTEPDYLPEYQDILTRFKTTLMAAQDRRPLLTHFDLKSDNIIVRPLREEDGEIKDWEVTMIDWDTLGWAPAFLQADSLNRFFSQYRLLWYPLDLKTYELIIHEEGEKIRQRTLALFDEFDIWKPQLTFLEECRAVTSWRR